MSVLARIASILVGITAILLGVGALNTALPTAAAEAHFRGALIGAIMSAYFVGFVLGARWAPQLIARVGYVRAFAAWCALVAAVILLHGLFQEPALWLFLRLACGICMAGLYMAVESWLNHLSTNEIRGRLFGFYMTLTLVAVGSGQWLIVPFGPQDPRTFTLLALFVALGIVPVALTQSAAPTPQPHSAGDRVAIHREVPLGASAALVSGVINSAFVAIAPLYGARMHFTPVEIAASISAAVIGGAVAQIPLGRLSDLVDRRRVILAICVVGVASVVAAPFALGAGFGFFVAASAVYGVCSYALYSTAASHVNDLLPHANKLAVARFLLLANGIGAVLGPLVGGWLVENVTPTSLFFFIGFCFFGLAVHAIQVLTTVPPSDHRARFVPITRTSEVAFEAMEELAEPSDTTKL
ncbi:MAG: MFS transporter [Betaproteobacteria bacterium]|nr:MFS transporter [Betaproteobacteria bacterium]